jgi:hypothetical protein
LARANVLDNATKSASGAAKIENRQFMEKAPQVIGLGTSNGSQKLFLVPSEHEHHSVDNYSFVSAVPYKKAQFEGLRLWSQREACCKRAVAGCKRSMGA